MSVNKQGHSGGSLLARWSRRKLEVDRNAADSMPAQEQERAPADNAAAPSDAPLKPLTDADMPDLASLTEESDFSAFMSSGVSDELRNLALRKLFRAPVFNIRDKLDDYDEDYTSFEELGGIVTSDMKHQVEMRRRKLHEALEQEPRQATLDESEAESGELLEAGPDDADDDGRAGATAGDEVAMNDEIAMNTVKKTEADDE